MARFKRYMRAALGAAISLVIAGITRAEGQVADSCAAEHLEGSVRHGDTLSIPFADSLLFRLAPATHPNNPQGWTIQVLIRGGGDSDFVAIATPPYRWSNPRYLNTSYGMDAEEVVTWTVREFRFVTNNSDHERMHEAVSTLLWPADRSNEELEAARELIDSIPTGHGSLRIISAKTRPPDPDFPSGLIERVDFEVDLCTP